MPPSAAGQRSTAAVYPRLVHVGSGLQLQQALADQYRQESIGAVAHRLGFSDAAHLSRTFRGRYGMTPREYRQLVATNLQVMRSATASER